MSQGAGRKCVTAYHEAGHVIVAYVQGIDFRGSSIRPNSLYGYRGFTKFSGLMEDSAAYRAEYDDLVWREGMSPDKSQELMREKVMSEATMLMAGPVAQSVVTGEHLRNIWSGDADRTLIKRIASDLEEEQALRIQASKAAREILRRNWPLVKAVADGLLAHETLTSGQLQDILRVVEGHD